jgi:hypothetical protein
VEWWSLIVGFALFMAFTVYLAAAGCVTIPTRGLPFKLANNPTGGSFTQCLVKSPGAISSIFVPLYRWDEKTGETYLGLIGSLIYILFPSAGLMLARRNREKVS